MAHITGNTYPVKDQLRALGGTWSGRDKAWIVPDALADQARAIVQGAPARAPRRPRYGSTYTRFLSDAEIYDAEIYGAAIYRNRAGRCEDAPCCGCCS